MIRIAIVDDHPIVTDGVVANLRAAPDIDVVATGGSANDAVADRKGARARRADPQRVSRAQRVTDARTCHPCPNVSPMPERVTLSLSKGGLQPKRRRVCAALAAAFAEHSR